MFGHQRGSSIVCQWRNAFKRHSSMNGGSFFFSDMMRMMSSFKPFATDSLSISVKKPYLYSRLASSWISLVAVDIVYPLSQFKSWSTESDATRSSREPDERGQDRRFGPRC